MFGAIEIKIGIRGIPLADGASFSANATAITAMVTVELNSESHEGLALL